MRTFFLTFDLEGASSSDYDAAGKRLAKLGLEPLSPSRAHYLPANTYSGRNAVSAEQLRDIIRASFERGGLVAGRLVVIRCDDWALVGKKVKAA